MAPKTENTNSEYNITYDEKIVNSGIEYENPMDISKIPVLSSENIKSLANVEVMFCTLNQKTPKMGHSITLIVDADFIQKDQQICDFYAQKRRDTGVPCRHYNSQLNEISNKDIPDGKYPESMKGKAILNIFTTNAKMFDADQDKGKSIQKCSEAKNGNVLVKYFANIDRYTGKAIQPQIFQVRNGQKVTTFTNPKTQQESPLYIGSKDIVSIKLRPYETHSDKNGYGVKYNLLEIEIVQTAFDRGIKKSSVGSSKRVETAPDAVDLSSLADMFGAVQAVVEPPKEVVETETTTSEVNNKKEAVVESPKNDIFDVGTLDFSSLEAELGSIGGNNV